ncbi:MAG: hypothetical protein ACRDS1_17210 [Pseudonocardiaceae bacterium]
MSAGPDAERSAVFGGYLGQMLVTKQTPAGDRVRLPESPRRIQPGDIERALDDPRLLFSADQDDPRHLRRLVLFALWLRYCPSDHLPRHLRSRAARFRFGVWSLLPRMGWPQEWLPLTVAWSMTDPGRENDFVVITRELVLAEARAARDDWLAQLNDWEDDPWLAARHQRDPGRLEADLRWLTTTWPRCGESAWLDGPGYLNLESDGVADQDPDERKKPTQHTRSPEWTNVIHGSDDRYPIAALGLPVGYFSSSSGFKATVEPKLAGTPLRRASPVWLRPVLLPGDRWAVFTHVFYARLLPPGAQLWITKGRPDPLPPPKDAEEAWDSWLGGDPRLRSNYYGGP